jgi:hypothetical protein
MARASLVALVVALLAGTASADWEKLVGKDAPDFTATWLRSVDGTSLDVLFGKAVVLAFWSPEAEGAADQLFLLNELHDRIYRRGGRVLVLTTATSEATKPPCDAEEVFCAVGVQAEHAAYGSGKLPYVYLVAPDRRVAWQGMFSALQPSTLDPVVKRSKPFVLALELCKENKDVADAFKKGRLVEASGWALEKAARSRKEAERLRDLRPFAELDEKEAAYIHSLVELNRVYWWSLVAEGRERQDYDRMLYGLDLIQRHLGGFANNAEKLGVRLGDDGRAADEARKLDTPEVNRSLEASKALVTLIAQPVPSSLTEAAKANRLVELEEFQKKWDGTCAARRAARRARWISGLATKG